MCCRINNSGFAGQVIKGLYILLATFLVGFFLVQAVKLLWHFDSVATDENAVKEVKEFNGCNNEDEITVWRWHDKPEYGSHGSLPRLGISNNGNNPAFFLAADLRIYPDSGAESIPVPPKNEVASDAEHVLKPGHTTVFVLPSDWDDKAGTIAFRYKLGKAKVWRFIRAHFEADQQFSDECAMSQP